MLNKNMRNNFVFILISKSFMISLLFLCYIIFNTKSIFYFNYISKLPFHQNIPPLTNIRVDKRTKSDFKYSHTKSPVSKY